MNYLKIKITKMTEQQKLKFANYIIDWLKEDGLLEDGDDCIDEEQLEETCMAGSIICKALVESGVVNSIGY